MSKSAAKCILVHAHIVFEEKPIVMLKIDFANTNAVKEKISNKKDQNQLSDKAATSNNEFDSEPGIAKMQN